jgi:ABC-type multidrug transport system ATPase subunit
MMQEAEKTFTYTAQRRAYLSFVGSFGFMLLAESSVFVLLISIFVHNNLLKFGLLSAYACFLLYLFFARLLAPLWTKHRLTLTFLHLHYGHGFKVSIPCTSISSALPVRERLTMFEPASARYDATKQRIIASFSEHGQILLRLAQPIALKMGHTTHMTESILINVDQRDTFLAALDLPKQRATLKEQNLMPIQQHDGTPLSLTDLQATTKVSPVDTPAISMEGLTRTFDAFKVVDNLNITMRAGEIYGFLGSNGAGKTTTMKMLAGLLQPSAGRVRIAGYDVWAEPLAAKAHLGYAADRAILYERLTGREFLQFLAQIRRLSQAETEQRIEYLLDLLDLTEQADRLCGAYSLGMKRKLALAGALLHQPRILVLDEPLNGLDPRSARRLKDLFAELASSGTAILLSTHDLASAEALCHRIGIIHQGRLLVEGSASELRAYAASPDLEAVFLQLTADELEVQL